MPSKTVQERRRRRRLPEPEEETDLEDVETIELAKVSPATKSNNSIILGIPESESDTDVPEELSILSIIKNKDRKQWAKVVAPVEKEYIKKKRDSIFARLSNFLWNASPVQWLLNAIENRSGFTIRSYFQLIIWLFYLNTFIFLLCFTCIIMPTYIYSDMPDFYNYTMDKFNLSSDSQQCTLQNPKCEALKKPFGGNASYDNNMCLSNPYFASGCCSLHTEAFFANSSRSVDWTKSISDVIDGTGSFTRNQLFIGYYRNLTKFNDHDPYFQTYNMGVAIFLTVFICFLLTGIIIIRKYGNGMKQSYVQTETFRNDLFQYVLARHDFRSTSTTIARTRALRFTTEMKNILFERDDKEKFNLQHVKHKILLYVKRAIDWLVTLLIFGGAIAAVYFVNRFTFQKRAEKEKSDGASQANVFIDFLVEYLPSITVTVINLVSAFIFAGMRNFNLYTRTTTLRYYLGRVIVMRLFLLFVFVFIIILQIICNTHQCGLQSKIFECNEIGDQGIFIHCWETLFGQAMYRLVLTDTAVMLAVHLIYDPLQSLLRYCSARRQPRVGKNQEAPKVCFLLQPLEFLIEDYVLDLTYTQTLCWYGLLFCPFLPLISSLKNILTFLLKFLALRFFRKRSDLELSPARTRHIFTAVLLFSFLWALLPVSFMATALRPSRGCGPFRIYSHEPDYYFYYSVRNVVTQIQANAVVEIILKLTSAVVIVPVILVLILLSCVLLSRRNSYRSASIELHKLLYTSLGQRQSSPIARPPK